MGDMWIAGVPRCPTHGQMHKPDPPSEMWTCAGWDGEGCPYTAQARWRHIGEVTELEFHCSHPTLTLKDLELKAAAEGRPWPPPFPGSR